MKLLFGTGNYFKFYCMKEMIKDNKNIELVFPKDIGIKVDVEEDGITAEENAIKKAKAYYDVVKMPVVTDDAALFINKFNDEEQPGLFVKRVNGIDNLSNEEIVDYYIEKLNKYGGESLAHYYVGICVIDEKGNIYSNTFNQKDFLLTSKKCEKKSMDGAALECISYDLDVNKYFDERTEEESKEHSKKFYDEYIGFIEKTLLNK